MHLLSGTSSVLWVSKDSKIHRAYLQLEIHREKVEVQLKKKGKKCIFFEYNEVAL